MSRSDLLGDLVAGVVITAFLVPVGMGYSQASGLPPVYGLYATVLPLLVYALFGPSKILVLGPDSSLAPLIAATIVPLAAGDPDRAVALAGALSIGAGLIALAAGIGKFGFVTELLSMPVRLGYLNGIAVVVILGQMPKLLGISVDNELPIGRLVDLVQAIGEVDRVPATVGIASLVGLIIIRIVAPRLPRSLVVVIGSIVAVKVFDLGGDLDLVGSLPPGFPVPAIPRVGWGDMSELAAGSLTIAVARSPTRACCRGPFEAAGPGGRPRSRVHRTRRRQCGCRVLPGFPGVCQLVSHAGGRSGRSQDPAHGSRRRHLDRAPPRRCSGPPRFAPDGDAGRHRHPRRDRPHRGAHGDLARSLAAS